MPTKALFAFAAIFLFIIPALAQDNHFDASINLGAAFGESTSGNGVSQSATTGSDLFGTVRFRFNRKQAVALNIGRIKDSQVYQTSSDFHVITNVTEYTGAYFYTPYQNAKLETFVFAGGGVLVFNPQSTWLFYNNNTNNPFGINQTEVFFGATKQTEIAFLYGGGLDFRLSAIPYGKKVPLNSHFALRLQYRGFIYHQPDFNLAGNTNSAPSFFTGTDGHLAVPSVGLVFKF